MRFLFTPRIAKRHHQRVGSGRAPSCVVSEEQRVADCRAGDRNAMAELFREHAPMLERLLCRLVGERADVEDLLQETFVQAIQAFPRFRGEASVKTWLYRIAVHVAQHHFRQPHRRRTVSLTVLPGGEEIPAPTTITSTMERRQHADLLYAYLNKLKPKQRVAFVLHVIEEKSMIEVAALMGATVTATKSRVFWARKRLLARVQKDPVLSALLQESR
jgi:RNA polymerase sigma-70 factor (ECF subfamily)